MLEQRKGVVQHERGAAHARAVRAHQRECILRSQCDRRETGARERLGSRQYGARNFSLALADERQRKM